MGECELPHTAHCVPDQKAPITIMTTRRRLALLTTLLAALTIVPSFAASAQTPEPTDDSGAPPVEPVGPETDDQGVEIIHSWALTPAGNDETGGGGNRANLSYTADPDTVLEDAVTLYNLGNVPLVFRIYATDAFNNPDGGFDILGAEEVPVDAGSWVDMGAEQITVDAQTQVTIPITISIPPGATPGDHVGALIASSAAVSTGEDGQQLTVDRRTGTRLYIRVNGPLAPEVTIENVQTEYSTALNPFGGSATVTYTIENRGNTVAGASVEASVSGPFGLGKQTAEPRELPDILPGESITFTDEFDGVRARRRRRRGQPDAQRRQRRRDHRDEQQLERDGPAHHGVAGTPRRPVRSADAPSDPSPPRP